VQVCNDQTAHGGGESEEHGKRPVYQSKKCTGSGVPDGDIAAQASAPMHRDATSQCVTSQCLAIARENTISTSVPLLAELFRLNWARLASTSALVSDRLAGAAAED